MKKRMAKVMLRLVLAPFSCAVCMLYATGCMLKTVSYLLFGAVDEAEREINGAFKYE